jgi:hypothetical protein
MVARMRAGRVPIISGITVAGEKRPKEHHVASPKLTMNHHAKAATIAAFAPGP